MAASFDFLHLLSGDLLGCLLYSLLPSAYSTEQGRFSVCGGLALIVSPSHQQDEFPGSALKTFPVHVCLCPSSSFCKGLKGKDGDFGSEASR